MERGVMVTIDLDTASNLDDFPTVVRSVTFEATGTIHLYLLFIFQRTIRH
jgi:hypothetical protein